MKATIGGQSAQVLFSGLTPGFARLYQVNVVVPSVKADANVPVVLTSGVAFSVTVTVAIQQVYRQRAQQPLRRML